jgi:hypothetical protein
MAKFHNGTKKEVLKLMARYAIRDQQALLEALSPLFVEPDEDTKIAIQETKDTIKDFRVIYAELKKAELKK